MQPAGFCQAAGPSDAGYKSNTEQKVNPYRPPPTSSDAQLYVASAAPALAQSLVLSRLSTSPTLLPSNLASLISTVSLAARVSVRAAALFIEAILETAKYSTYAGMGITRRALIQAVSSANAIHYFHRALDWSGLDAEGERSQDNFLAILEKYTTMGIYMIHHSFSLAELFAMSGFYLTINTFKTGFAAAVESVRLVDSLLGSNETSRALAAIITLVRSELTQDPRFSPAQRGAIASLTALTKALTAFVCLQGITHKRTLKELKLKVVYDCTILLEGESEKDFSLFDFGRGIEGEDEEPFVSAPSPLVRSREPSIQFDRRSEISISEGRRSRSRSVSVNQEEEEITHELVQLCGTDEEESEDESPDLPEEVELALREVQESGAFLGDGKRVVLSPSSGYQYEIETEETTTTTTTIVRTMGLSSDEIPRTIARRTRPLISSNGEPGSPTEGTIEELLEEEEWVEVTSQTADGAERPTVDEQLGGISQIPSATNGALRHSVATLSRQDTLDHPKESKERLQIVLKKMTKTFTQRKRTVRRIDVDSRGTSPVRTPRSKSADRSSGKARRRDVRDLEWPGVETLSRRVPSAGSTGDDLDMSHEEDSNSGSITPTGSPAPSTSKSKSNGVLRAFSKALKKSPSNDKVFNVLSKSSSGYSTPLSPPRSPASRPPPQVAAVSPPSSATLPSAVPIFAPYLNSTPASGTSTPTRLSAELSTPSSPSRRSLAPPALSPMPGSFAPGATATALPPRLRRTRSNQSMRSVVTTFTHDGGPTEEPEPKASNFPHQHLVKNLQTFMRYSSAAYGQTFLRILGIGKHDFNFPHTSTNHANNYAFAHHVGIKVDDILLSSFSNTPTSAFATPKINPLVNFVALDHSVKAVVLSCRGSLGLSDLLVDLTCTYEPIPIEHGDPHGSYYVHSGMYCSATTMQRGTVHETIKDALRLYPDYGLVLCGHSLGGGVAGLLSILWSSPASAFERQKAQQRLSTGERTFHPTISTPFVTSFSSGLPPGRPISCYSFGPPCVASPDLVKYCRGLVTSIVHNFDIVPTLSLGVLRDLKNTAMGLYSEAGTAEEIVGRVIGLHQRRFMAKRAAKNATSSPPTDQIGEGSSLTDVADEARVVRMTTTEIEAGKGSNKALDPAYRDPSLLGPDASEDQELNDWLWSLVKTMRAGHDNEKLYPPGTVYVMESWTVFTTAESPDPKVKGSKYSRREGRRVILREVENVEARFSEPIFGRTMMSDHSPSGYEEQLELLATAVLG
ncbi:hypothetical protein T439DRAFT_324739 [Meredithblackwellia eburnea MCA 4105]